MDFITILLTACTLCFAAVIQSAVGFAFALFSTPVLIWIGIPLHKVIVIVAAGSMMQSFAGVRKLKAFIPWKDAIISTALRVIWLFAGLFILKHLVGLEARYIKLAVGSVLCLLVLIQYFWRPKPAETIHWIFSFIAFSLSGLLAGIAGMGGPPLVLWTMAHNWPPERTRGFFFATFLTFIPLQLMLLCLLPGIEPLWTTLLAGFAFAPVVVIGSSIGLALGRRMSRQRLYSVTCICLLLMGTVAIVSSLFTASKHNGAAGISAETE
ncbi:MAG: TSUP family transporter [Kiritimatiellales bacterium]